MLRPETIRQMLEKSAENYKKRCAFTFLDADGKTVEITYERLKRDVDYLSLYMLHVLKAQGEKAVISCYNCYQWCVVYLACLCSGVVAVPVDRELSGEDIGNLIDFAQVKFVFSDKKTKQKLQKRTETNYFVIGTQDESELQELFDKGENLKREGYSLTTEIDPDETAVLLFTSGTTGNPKGVMLSNRNICSDLYLVSKNVQSCERDRTLSVLPLHHTYETIAFLMMIYCGGSIAFCGGIRYLGKSFFVFSPTIFVTVPLILEKLHSRILSEIDEKGMYRKFRFASLLSSKINPEKKKKLFSDVHSFFGGRLSKIIVGAAAVEESAVQDFELFGFWVIIGYGLTECSPIVICNSEIDRTTDTVGRPLGEVEVKIHLPDEKGVGEIRVKGPMVMKGYYKNKAATDEVFRDGWFCTGDLGYKDKNGRYHIMGRCKNVIVTKNGKNIYPEELEQALMKNPFIKECLVYGEKGDIVSCEIFPDEAAICQKLKKASPGEDEIKSIINETVRSVNRLQPSYKRIKKVVVRKDGFDKTSTHKIKRKY